jgi:hypothetical protein
MLALQCAALEAALPATHPLLVAFRGLPEAALPAVRPVVRFDETVAPELFRGSILLLVRRHIWWQITKYQRSYVQPIWKRVKNSMRRRLG